MGGIGSGRQMYWSTRDYVDDNISLDIRRLKREELLYPGSYFGWQWTTGNDAKNDIRIKVENNRVILFYRQRVNGGEWQRVEEPVNLTYTNCNYGGERAWFVCPSCGSRVAKLYSHRPYFLCRKCHGTPYQSQSENTSDRMMRKARKIRTRLGADQSLSMPIFLKPKGMHQKTFDRLRKKAEKAEQIVWREMASYLDRLEGQVYK